MPSGNEINKFAPIQCQALLAGAAHGELLCLDGPLSFWGGVSPQTARITDPRHPQFESCLKNKIVVMTPRGSSSSSAVLLEMIHADVGPAAIVLDNKDAIIVLGAIVAREIGHAVMPIVQLCDGRDWLRSGLFVDINEAVHSRVDSALSYCTLNLIR